MDKFRNSGGPGNKGGKPRPPAPGGDRQAPRPGRGPLTESESPKIVDTNKPPPRPRRG